MQVRAWDVDSQRGAPAQRHTTHRPKQRKLCPRLTKRLGGNMPGLAAGVLFALLDLCLGVRPTTRSLLATPCR